MIECDVLELLPYVALFDWSSATKAFERSGNTEVLAELLRANAAGLTPKVSAQLEGVAQKLDNVTLALELARPEEAIAEIDKLKHELKKGKASFQQYAKPFDLLGNLIITTFEKIGLPQTGVFSLEPRRETERELIRWYKDKKHLVLAIQLAREWVLSKYLDKKPSPTKPKKQPSSGGKNQEYKRRDEAARSLGSDTTTSIELYNAFKAIREVRNDIAHMGQAGNTQSAKKLKAEIEKTLKMLDDIQ